MKIKGAESLSLEALEAELQSGGKFVTFQYCISLIEASFHRHSHVYYIKPGQSAFSKGLIFTVISLLFGWWAIPHGPIYTLMAVVSNCKGGKNVTPEIVRVLEQAGQDHYQSPVAGGQPAVAGDQSSVADRLEAE